MKSTSRFFSISMLIFSSILFLSCSSKMDVEQNNGSDQQISVISGRTVSKTSNSELDNKKTLAGSGENEPVPVDRKNNQVLPIDTAKSRVQVLVMKKGKLERIGHNHVIENRNLTGEVIWDGRPENVRASLSLPVEQFIVDDAELRKKAGKGFEDEVQVSDILSIRRTMLGDRVLAAAEFPAIKITIQGVSAPSIDQAVDISLTIRGVTKTFRTAARIYEHEGTVLISGRLSLRQSDFGITPITLLLGKLTIQDTVRINYALEAGKQ